jgi:hypothetical protein
MHARIQRLKREAQPHFEFEFNVNKCLRLVSHECHAFVQAVDKIGIYYRSAEI